MRVEIEEKDGEELDESRNEVAKLIRKLRIRYSREFLLSYSKFKTRTEFTSDYDSFLLCEPWEGDFSGSIEPSRIEGKVSLHSSDRSGHSPSLSSEHNSDGILDELVNKGDSCSFVLKNNDSKSQRNANPDSSSQESARKCDGHLSWLKNKHCQSKCNHDPDPEISYRDNYQLSLQNPNNDEFQGAAAVPRVSGCTVSAPSVQVHYQLKKCENPYRPPHVNKAKNVGVNYTLNSEKGSPATSLSDKQQNENRSVKQPDSCDQQDDPESIDTPAINVNNYAGSISSSDDVSEYLHALSAPSLEAIDKSEAYKTTEFTDHEADKSNNVEADDTIGLTLCQKRTSPCFLEEDNAASGRSAGIQGIHQMNRGYDGAITRHSTAEVSAVGIRLKDKPMSSSLPSSTFGNYEQTYSCLTPTRTQAILTSVVRQPVLSDGKGSSLIWNHPIKKHNVSEVDVEQQDSAKPATFSKLNMGFSPNPHYKEVQPDEPAISIQIGSVNLDMRQDNSKSCGTEFSDLDDEFLISLLNDSGAFEMFDEDIRARKFSMRNEINEIEDDQSDCENVWGKIVSMIRMEQDIHGISYDKNLIQSDYTEVYDVSKFVIDGKTVVPRKEEPKTPPPPDLEKADCFRNEICLPDEDSLITIEDLIAPLSLEELENNISSETDMLTLEVDNDEQSMVLRLSPKHVHLQKSSPQSHKTKMKRGQAQLSSRINFVDTKTGRSYLPPPVCCSCTDKSWISPLTKLKSYMNTVCYSVLDQPWDFPQQNQLHKGPTFPDPIKQSGSYKPELHRTYIHPLNHPLTSYQGRARPALDFGRLGENNGQPNRNGFIGMDLEPPMPPFGIGGCNQAQQLTPNVDPGVVNHRASTSATSLDPHWTLLII